MTLRLSYMDSSQTKQTVSYDVRAEVANFLGKSQAILQPGQTDSFLIRLADVQQFLEASFQLDSAGDDWQLKSITIKKPNSINQPSAVNSGAAGKVPSSIDAIKGSLGPIQEKNFLGAVGYKKSDNGWERYKSVMTVLTGLAENVTWKRSFSGIDAASCSRQLFIQGAAVSGSVLWTTRMPATRKICQKVRLLPASRPRCPMRKQPGIYS